MIPAAVSHSELARVVREHAGQLAASLVGLIGDFAAAEDLVQDAVLAALERWPAEGIPERPEAWLFTVARRRGLDVLRRGSNYRAKLTQLQWAPQPASEVDDRLRLVFTCCHPALSRAAQIALTLRVVCAGVTPTGPRSCCCTTCCCTWPVAGHPPAPGDRAALHRRA